MTTEPWITIAALAALAGAANSQQQQPQTPPAARPDQARPRDASVRPFELYKLDKLIGLEVRGAENKVVGSIDDLIVASNDGAIEFVVLSSGGVAGIGDKKHLLPWREIEWSSVAKDGEQRCEARVSLNEEQVKGLREFDKKAAKKDAGSDSATTTNMLSNTCSTEIKGHKVLDDANQDVGSIDEVVIDTMAGRVAYVVLAVGGTLGLGEKRYPLPWTALRVQRDSDGDLEIHANVSKERLKSAPEYDKSKWEAMTTPDWVHGVYVYYSVNPYWSGARPASSPTDKEKK